MQTFKLFVASPGDVMVERQRVENVVSRLNGEFAGVARLEAIRWETEFYQAYSTFQAQIPPSTQCDLVIGILKWRLGTELPPDFAEKLPDGQPFPSGTAYEILTAIEKRQKGETLPDIYVFRFAGSSPSVAIEDPNRAMIEHDWQGLKGFFQEWFLSEGGRFKAAFNPYSSEDDFEAQLGKLLRKWVADKVAGGQVVRWPIMVKGSPFRGLAAFGAKHSPVFFGRSHDTARAVDLWREAGSRGSPYLLVVGASGSGKSSLARAGLVPRLTTPGVIKQVDIWRVAVMRPGDSLAGPFAALAAALMQDEAGLPKEEESRGSALPEIALGDSQTPAELASVLRHADAVAIKPIVNAVSRVAASEHDHERYSRDARCDLVLLIDQLDELFAAPVSEAERAGFIDLVAALVETGRIWVVATLRADFYARMLDQPALKRLKELGATYDLAPPGPVELAEIVRGPAEAASLVFETDAASGEGVDVRLLHDADRPDMLPLVQLALSRLFEGREFVGGEIRLPLKVYESLGGLKGIVNEAGETALASLGEFEKARLPQLLRQLAVPANDRDGIGKGALTIRAVPLAQAAPDEAARKLVDALVTARLLTTSGIEADAQVRLAHQRVLDDWSRAHTVATESAEFYRIRADLEESRRKWETGNHRSELLLARGLPLAEAESIVGKYGDELEPELLAYVRASRKRANRRQTLTAVAAVLFAIVAVAAIVAARQARDQRQRTEEALASMMQIADSLVFDMGKDLRVLKGQPDEPLRQMYDRAIQGSDQAIKLNPTAAAYNTRGAAYYAKGDLDHAIADYTEAILLDPKYARAYNGRGVVYLAKKDFNRAIVECTEAILLDPKLAYAYASRGDAYFSKDDYDRAIADYTEAIRLDPKGTIAYYNRGGTYYAKGDYDRAISDYTEVIRLDPKFAFAYNNRGHAYDAKGDYDHAIVDFDQAILPDPKFADAYDNRGHAHDAKGDYDRAIVDFDQAIKLDPKFAFAYYHRGHAYDAKGDYDRAIVDFDQAIKLDPKFAFAYYNRGVAYHDKGDNDRAIADYTEAIRLDPEYEDAYANRGVAYHDKDDNDRAIADYSEAIRIDPKFALAFNNRGDAYRDKGDNDRAIADYSEAIRIDPKNSGYYDDRGDAYRDKGDYDRAIADYSEAIRIDPKNSDYYNRRGIAYGDRGDNDRAIADYTEAIRLDPKVDFAYNNRGLAYRDKGDNDRAIADYTEAIRIDPKDSDYHNHRGSAYRAKGDNDRAIADYTEAIRLDPEDAKVFDDRGDAYRAKGDNERAIADYTEAIKTDPEYGPAHLHRGQAYLYGGSLAQALADFRQANEIDQNNAYAALWLDLAARRNNMASNLAQTAKQLDMQTWPAPLVRLFLGELTPTQTFAAADDNNPKTKRAQVCEANFYYGELELLKGAKDEADRLFHLAASDCPKDFSEWSAANAEVKALATARSIQHAR